MEKALGSGRVCLGVTTAGATLLGPGRVRAGGSGKVSLGSHPGVEPIADALQQAGFEVEVVADAQALLWGKLVINAAINPLTALMRVPNGELLRRPSARALMGEAAREAAQVAAAKAIKLPYADPRGDGGRGGLTHGGEPLLHAARRAARRADRDRRHQRGDRAGGRAGGRAHAGEPDAVEAGQRHPGRRGWAYNLRKARRGEKR